MQLDGRTAGVAGQPDPELLLQPEQRAHGVDRRPARVRLAEDVVEDLERQGAPVARADDVLQEAGQVEAALAREAPVVAAPLQDVHRQLGGVGELQEEDLVARDLRDACRVVAAGQDVEAVEADADVGRVDQADPRVQPGDDVLDRVQDAARLGLDRQADRVPGRAPQLAQLVDQPRELPDGRRVAIASNVASLSAAERVS